MQNRCDDKQTHEIAMIIKIQLSNTTIIGLQKPTSFNNCATSSKPAATVDDVEIVVARSEDTPASLIAAVVSFCDDSLSLLDENSATRCFLALFFFCFRKLIFVFGFFFRFYFFVGCEREK
jgi:hypothetical protein